VVRVPPRHVVPLGTAAVRRRGRHLTLVATSVMVGRSLAAAAELATEGVELSVVDPRTISPLDTDAILTEVAATGRALLVQEAPRTAGFMAEVAARIAESEVFGVLRAPIGRLCGLDAPIPYAPELEKVSVPQVADIVTEARRLAREG
jgi:acetoin:2,6-dichlorophenolindophenol oxidoreductase subunit beta